METGPYSYKFHQDRWHYGTSSRELKLNPVLVVGEQNVWRAIIYQDDLKSPFNPNVFIIRKINAGATAVLDIPLSAGGGFAIKLERM